MSDKLPAIKSRLFKLKEWLLVPEAAQYLSMLFNEEVKDTDVLRLALDKHLTLSVDFVNHTYVRRGKIVPLDEAEWYPPGFFSKMPGASKEFEDKPILKSLCIDENRFIKLDEKVSKIEGVWDLSMLGTERLDIEHEFQMLTGGPEVTLQGLDGAFIQRDNVICQLQESFDQNEYQSGSEAQLEKIKEHIASNNIGEEKAKELLEKHKEKREEYLKRRRERDHSHDYYPAGGLPRDSVLVVRTQALIDLQERLSQADADKATSLDSRAETTYLNIIGAMLETFVHKDHGEVNFPSEAKLREFLSEGYAGFKGLTERTLAEKFAAAKKAIREEFD